MGTACGTLGSPRAGGRYLEVGWQEVGEGKSGGGRTQKTVLLSLRCCLGQSLPSFLAYRNKVY